MKSFKLNFTALAFILGSVIAISQSAFTPAKKSTAGRFSTQYQYNGTTLADDKFSVNYSPISGTGPTCDNANQLPCVVTVTGSLQTWLDARTDIVILAQSTHTRD